MSEREDLLEPEVLEPEGSGSDAQESHLDDG